MTVLLWIFRIDTLIQRDANYGNIDKKIPTFITTNFDNTQLTSETVDVQ